jgi:hypothetical protein
MDTIQSVSVVSPVAQAIHSLIDSRIALVGAAKKTGQVVKAYAKALEQTFNLVDNQGNVTTKWYDLQGALRKGVKAERVEFVTAMEAEGFTKATIDVYWQRVKEASGYVTAGNKAKGDADIDAKTLAELKTMLNRIFNDETESVSQTVKPLLMSAFEQLGGDVMKLGTNNK